MKPIESWLILCEGKPLVDEAGRFYAFNKRKAAVSLGEALSQKSMFFGQTLSVVSTVTVVWFPWAPAEGEPIGSEPAVPEEEWDDPYDPLCDPHPQEGETKEEALARSEKRMKERMERGEI